MGTTSPSNIPGGRIVFAVYKPHPGREADFLKLLEQHVPTLRAKGLVTERAPIIAKAADGSIVEVFEWVSEEAANGAHDIPAVMAVWERMEMVASFMRLGSLAEANKPFPHFAPLSF